MLGSILGFAGSALGGIFGSSSANKANKTQMAMQKDQQKFNAQQTAIARAYNSPINQRKLLEQAGLNPDSMYGQSSAVVPTTAATSGQGSAHSAPVPNFAGDLAQLANITAQGDLMKAQADKVRSETKGQGLQNDEQAIRNEFVRSLYTNELKLGDSTLSLNEQNKEYISKNMDKVSSETALIQNNIAKVKADTDLTKETFKYYSLQKQAEIFESNMRSKSLKAQVDRLYMLLPHEASSASSEAGIKIFEYDRQKDITANLQSMTEKVQKEVEKLVIENRYGDAREVTSLFTNVLNSACTIVKSVKPY